MTMWALALGALAIVALIIIPLWGVHKFSPQRARHVKYAEREYVEVVQQRVIELAVHHPEIGRMNRLDRHPFYLGPHIGVLGYSLSIFCGAQATSNVIALGLVTRYTMASCYFVGALLVLTGALMGAKIGRWRFRGSVHDHPTSPLLGDDVSLPYLVGTAGLSCVVVSMSIYSYTSFHSTFGSLGGWLTLTLAIVSAVMIATFWVRLREFERHESILLAEVQTRLTRDCDDHH